MQYRNAKEVLPEELLRMLQKYAEGSLIYIPRADPVKSDRRRDERIRLKQRNEEIRRKKKNGSSIEELMKEYYLSYDTIKRIVYSKN